MRVTEIELDHAVSSGAEMRTLGKGMVAVFEEHTARLERDICLEEWQAMDPFEKALIIAQRRIQIALENLQSEAQIKAAKMKGARKR